MTKQRQVLERLFAEGPQTTVDLIEHFGFAKQTLFDIISLHKREGRLTTSRDADNNRPLYTITPAGREWLSGGSEREERANTLATDLGVSRAIRARKADDAAPPVKPVRAMRRTPKVVSAPPAKADAPGARRRAAAPTLCKFARWSDGAITIADGGQSIQLEAADADALRAFLGVAQV